MFWNNNEVHDNYKGSHTKQWYKAQDVFNKFKALKTSFETVMCELLFAGRQNKTGMFLNNFF